MELVKLGEAASTPWAFSPLWFVGVAVLIPAVAWVALAWRQAFLEDPNRLRRSGVREMRRLISGLRRSRSMPQSRHLHAWMRATARTWGVRVSAPTSVEVVKACRSITADTATVSRWRDLWHATERGLFAPDAKAPQDWLDQASSAAAGVEMPRRERRFPNRRSHWLPSVAAALMGLVVGAALPGASRADVPLSADDYAKSAGQAVNAPVAGSSANATRAGTDGSTDGGAGADAGAAAGATAGAPGLAGAASRDAAAANAPGQADVTARARAADGGTGSATASEAAGPEPMDPQAMLDAQKAARDALAVNWNDWAAHHNMAALGIETENWNIAIAYATASFLQHPSSSLTRETLRLALEQTQTADEHLRKMVSGAWYERIPSMLSAAGWQRVSIFAGLFLALALTALIATMYFGSRFPPTRKRYLTLTARAAVAAGVIALSLCVTGWTGYGALSRPEAAILLTNVDVSPTPTDLIPVNETSPAAAGTIVLTQRTFLGWQQIRIEGRPAGWVRKNTLMPIYARGS